MSALAEPLLLYGDLLARGLALTLGISAAAILAGLLLAGPLLALRLAPPRACRVSTVSVVELLRSLPFLVLLLIVHFGLPTLGWRLPAWGSGILALSLYGAAYFTEALRAAYLSLPAGQVEAGRALGLAGWSLVRRVIAPQLIAAFAPAARVIAIMLLKESAVLSIITVPELTHASLRIQAETFSTVPTFLTIALLYWLSAQLVGLAGSALESRFTPCAAATPRRGPVAARYLTLDRMPLAARG